MDEITYDYDIRFDFPTQKEADQYIDLLTHYDVEDWYRGEEPTVVFVEHPDNWELPDFRPFGGIASYENHPHTVSREG